MDVSFINKLFKSKSNDDFCTAVVLAAGNSQRMGKDKILMPLGGAPVIAHTLKALQSAECIDEIVVVTKYESLQELADICNDHGISKASKVVVGGKTRLESSLIGVSNADERAKYTAIHTTEQGRLLQTALLSALFTLLISMGHQRLPCPQPTPCVSST